MSSGDLIAFVHQQLENQRHRAEGLKTMSCALPAETGAYLTETADLLLADVDAKRRILAEHPVIPEPYRLAGRCERCSHDDEIAGEPPATHPCPTVRLLALSYAAHPDYREEWKPE